MTPRRTKILIIQPECHDRSHDPTDLVEQMIAGFPREKYEVTSAFLQGKRMCHHPESGAEHVVYFDLPDIALRGLRLRLRWLLYRLCKTTRFDVVICNRYKPVSLLMHLNCWLKIPLCIGISHGMGEYRTFWRQFFAKRFINPAWKFVGVSPAVRDHLIALNCGFNSSNTIAICNAIDIHEAESSQFTREEARASLGLPPEATILGSIGRLARVKGYTYLLRAFSKIHNKFPEALLVLIGDGKEETNLRNEAKNLGIHEKVRFLGFQPQASRYVRAFDLWVMPSLSEGLPRALLEGMSGHLPVITSDIPALRPIVLGAGGLLAPPSDADALAIAIDYYLSLTPAKLQEIGEAAYQYLGANHDIQFYRASYLSLLEQPFVGSRK